MSHSLKNMPCLPDSPNPHPPPRYPLAHPPIPPPFRHPDRVSKSNEHQASGANNGTVSIFSRIAISLTPLSNYMTNVKPLNVTLIKEEGGVKHDHLCIRWTWAKDSVQTR
jgi:hypothetical protein